MGRPAHAHPARQPAGRQRLDAVLVARGLVASRPLARAAVAAGGVLVDGVPATKPARLVGPAQRVELTGDPEPVARYVSRAGVKLRGALDRFGLDPAGRRCLDAGASTGGFTDCLLQAGAAQVVAVDVGTGQLHPRLGRNPRVVSLERTDVRTLTPAAIGGPVEVVVADLSFISLRLVLEALAGLVVPGGPVVALVKPQFEAGRVEAARSRGVIRDPALWHQALSGVAEAALDLGMGLRGASVSDIRGAGGNVEFVVWWTVGHPGAGPYQQVLADLDLDSLAEMRLP